MKKIVLLVSVLSAFALAQCSSLFNCEKQCVRYDPYPKCTKYTFICKNF